MSANIIIETVRDRYRTGEWKTYMTSGPLLSKIATLTNEEKLSGYFDCNNRTP